jgi:hypothetical protein
LALAEFRAGYVLAHRAHALAAVTAGASAEQLIEDLA